jgi:hypothetical protein
MVATIQYRLGKLGFLAGKELGEQGLLNLGLQDQLLALRWLHVRVSGTMMFPSLTVSLGRTTLELLAPPRTS